MIIAHTATGFPKKLEEGHAMKVRRDQAVIAALVVGAALLAAGGCGGSGGKSTGATTGTAAPKQGGTIHINLATDTDYTDPALAYYSVSWQFEYATGLKLLNYPDLPAPEGSRLQPEAAAALPVVSADGKTYTFTVKDGFQFSPPSNEPVTAANFKRAIERVLNPKMQSPGASFIADIAGAEAFRNGKAETISGLKVEGNTLTITLTEVAPDFLSRIAMPFFSAVPVSTPITPAGEIKTPSAGPYYIESWTPKRQLVLARNPNYHGDRPANADKLVYTVGVNPAQGFLQIKAGQADYAADGIPPSAHSEVGPKYGPGSPAARAGKQRYFVNATLAFRYLGLNTSRPLFSDAKLRQAVNFAIDRALMIRQRGAHAGRPTDQYLPYNLNGFTDAQIYPLGGPDVAKAKQLAAGSKKGKAVMYTCNASPCPETAQIVQANLKEIGIDVEIKQFQRAIQFQKQGTKGEPFDIAFDGWQADYADPYDFINVLLDGTRIQAANNVNFAYFNDPAFTAKMQAAARLAGDDRLQAYGQLDIELARDAAPLAAWVNDNDRDFFSERIGCQVYSPVYTMDLAALCVRG